MKRVIVATLLAAYLVSPPAAHASGWVQPPGHCYGKLWDRSWFGARAYTAEGLRDGQDVAAYHDHLVNLYGECGVLPWLTAAVALSPAGYARSGGEGTFYLGPFTAGARFGLLRDGPVRLATTARYGYAPAVGHRVLSRSPITTSDGGSSEAIYQPAVENHFAELSLGLGYGFTIRRAPAYLAGTVGVRLNTAASIDHALIGELRFGVTLLDALALSMHSNLYEPFFQPVTVTNTAGAGQTRYLGLGLTVSYWLIEQLAVFANIEGVFYAESNAATPSLSFGLETRLRL